MVKHFTVLCGKCKIIIIIKKENLTYLRSAVARRGAGGQMSTSSPRSCESHIRRASPPARFLYEYSRRHPEHSAQLILRLVKEYKDLLDQCCTTENAEVCVAQLEEQINKHIADNLEVIKPYCDSAKQGDYVFQNVQLLVYTKRAPQLSFDDLYKYTKQLADVGAKCCPLNDTKLLACVDESVDFVLGAMCLQQEHQPINEQVSRCCSGPYPFRRLCFLSLGVDEKYTPVPFSPELHEDLCPDYPEELKRQKESFRIIVSLVKHKPDITENQLKAVTLDFSIMLQKCCKAENREESFKEESPKFVERTQTAFGEH